MRHPAQDIRHTTSVAKQFVERLYSKRPFLFLALLLSGVFGQRLRCTRHDVLATSSIASKSWKMRGVIAEVGRCDPSGTI